MIRSQNPELKSVSYLARQDVRVLNVSFKSSAFWRLRAHLYWDWNCLNSFLAAEIVLHTEFNYAELTFAGLYNPDLTSKAYRALPSVTTTESGGLIGDTSNCISPAMRLCGILFDIAGGDCPAGCTEHELHYFEVSADGHVQKTTTWIAKRTRPHPRGPPPTSANTHDVSRPASRRGHVNIPPRADKWIAFLLMVGSGRLYYSCRSGFVLLHSAWVLDAVVMAVLLTLVYVLWSALSRAFRPVYPRSNTLLHADAPILIVSVRMSRVRVALFAPSARRAMRSSATWPRSPASSIGRWHC